MRAGFHKTIVAQGSGLRAVGACPQPRAPSPEPRGVAFDPLKHTSIWLPAYLRTRVRRPPSATPIHVLFCIADHFEPDWNRATEEEQLRRVDRWARDYPCLARAHRDRDGRHPRWTFFYPAEAYQADVLERLAQLCRAGWGEAEVHLHHDGDTSASLSEKLERAKADFARHGLLARERATTRVRFGFVHGNWALDNSGADGRWCGVNNELEILRDAGCYADFTLPSAPSPTQTRKINSLYYATDDPQRPKSHDTGRDVAVGGQANGDLLIVQGPLTLNWRRRKYGLLPRIENGELSATSPPSRQRADLWVQEAAAIRGKEDWRFVKVYTHGAKPANTEVLLGEPMDALFSYLESRYNDGTRYRLHYVTAREMYNIIKAAEHGETGEPGQYRDFELVSPMGTR